MRVLHPFLKGEEQVKNYNPIGPLLWWEDQGNKLMLDCEISCATGTSRVYFDRGAREILSKTSFFRVNKKRNFVVIRGSILESVRRTINGVRALLSDDSETKPSDAVTLAQCLTSKDMEEMGLRTIVVMHQPVWVETDGVKKNNLLCVVSGNPMVIGVCAGDGREGDREFGKSTGFLFAIQ